jgi:hypothetical protein
MVDRACPKKSVPLFFVKRGLIAAPRIYSFAFIPVQEPHLGEELRRLSSRLSLPGLWRGPSFSRRRQFMLFCVDDADASIPIDLQPKSGQKYPDLTKEKLLIYYNRHIKEKRYNQSYSLRRF